MTAAFGLASCRRPGRLRRRRLQCLWTQARPAAGPQAAPRLPTARPRPAACAACTAAAGWRGDGGGGGRRRDQVCGGAAHRQQQECEQAVDPPAHRWVQSSVLASCAWELALAAAAALHRPFPIGLCGGSSIGTVVGLLPQWSRWRKLLWLLPPALNCFPARGFPALRPRPHPCLRPATSAAVRVLRDGRLVSKQLTLCYCGT